jgi:hypothetical protein
MTAAIVGGNRQSDPVNTPPETFTYDAWRHGGWYVLEVRYPSGAVGCVSRNYTDRKWRIACDPRPGAYPGGENDFTYPNRDAAARAEWELAELERERERLVAAHDFDARAGFGRWLLNRSRRRV